MAIDKWFTLQCKQMSERPEIPQVDASVHGPKVLVVDDDHDTRAMVRLALQHANFVVQEADNGPAALAKLQTELFNALVIDIAMPGMDGTSVIEMLPTLPYSRDIPVVVITALYPEGSREIVALESGASVVLHKPFDPKRLVQTLMQHCACA